MTQEFEGAGLSLTNAALGLSGVDAEQQTFLDDGSVAQVLPIDAIARRSLTPFRFNQFYAVLENIHGVAGELQSFVDPYNPINVHNNFPASVDPNKFDIWLDSASVVTTGGSSVNWSILQYDANELSVGMSDLASGGPADIADRVYTSKIWNDFATIALTTGQEHGLNALTLEAEPKVRQRCLPGVVWIHRSEVTGAVAIQMILSFAIFPISLGQDAW